MTLGEIMRRLTEIAEAQRALLTEIRDERHRAAETFVRKDVYQIDLANQINDVTDIRADRRRDEDRARQFQLWLIGLSVTALVAIAGVLFNFVTARGGA